MANQAYENALATGKVVVRKWWVNTNSQNNQVTVQFQQAVERPQDNVSSLNSLLIGLEQGSEIGNTTRVTALRSFNADNVAAVLGSKQGDATMGSNVMFANDLYRALGLPEDIDVAIQVTENFEKNPKSATQTPKVNPSTGEVVVATNPKTNTQMPVYRHTDIVIAHTCNHTFVASESRVNAPAQVAVSPFNALGEIAS